MHVFSRVSLCHLHYTVMLMLKRKKLLSKLTFKCHCRERIRQSIRKVKYHASRQLTSFSCNKLMCSCKNGAHVANYYNYKLNRDVEKHPGSSIYVDPNETTVAPYSQGKQLLFGQNAGQQCVVTSLCSLIYNKTQGISSANDLIQNMDIGNQLYSSLSWFARQACLMQSELPTVLNVFDADYQLEYSESYSGNVHQEIAIGGYQYCKSLGRAFESLISESFYCNSNMGFKIFDSHA